MPPGYWMNETSGVLAAVVKRYLHGETLSDADVETMRLYLKQWIEAPLFYGPEVADLRARVDGLTTTVEIQNWIADAVDAGIDPL